MRAELWNSVNPKEMKKSAPEQYRDMLSEAGQVVDDNDPQFSRVHDSGNSALVREDSDSGIGRPFREDVKEYGEADQIAFLETTVKALLGTGNYIDDYPDIRRLRLSRLDCERTRGKRMICYFVVK
jgi:hypothetical protein